MKNRIMRFGLVFMMILAASLQAQLLVENFDYPAGDNVSAHGWTSASFGASVTVATAGLDYAGYALSGIGNAALLPISSEEAMRSFAAQNSGSVYVSFMVNVHDAEDFPGSTFLYLGPAGTSIFARHLSCYVEKTSPTEILFGVHKESGIDYVSTVQSFNTTYLIVLKYQFNTGSDTDDEVSIWVNPPTDGTIPVSDGSIDSGYDGTSLEEIILSSNLSSSTQTMTVDGIQVTTAWPLGNTDVSESLKTELPLAPDLSQNYPNPFNPETALTFTLPKPSEVSLIISDNIGRIVDRPVSGRREAGVHTVLWSGEGLPSGLYICTLRAGQAVITRKMLLLR